MKKAALKFFFYGGIAALLLGVVVLSAFTLLCWLTPSVTVKNDSSEPLNHIVITLPSSTLQFDTLKPGESGEIFYDAKQADGVYKLNLVRGTQKFEIQCGNLTRNEWGKRMVILVTDSNNIECKERLRF